MKNNRNLLFTSLFIAIIAISQFFLFDVVHRENGYGWDGRFYGNLAENFFVKSVWVKYGSVYYANRIFPSFFINIIIRIFNITPAPKTIVLLFQITNLALILVSNYLWKRICVLKNFSSFFFYLGFTILFVNYMVLKVVFWDPVMTDTFAFTFGITLLYANIIRSRILLLFIGIIGTFTFPPLLICTLVFILFDQISPENKEPGQKNQWWIIPFVICGMFAVLSFYLNETNYKNKILTKLSAFTNDRVFTFNIIINSLVIFYILYNFLLYVPGKYAGKVIRAFIHNGIRKRILDCILLITIVFLCKYAISNILLEKTVLMDHFMSSYDFLINFFVLPLSKPLFSIVEAFAQGGIFVYFLIICLSNRKFYSYLLSMEISFIVIFLLFLTLKIMPELRITIFLFPIIVYIIISYFKNIEHAFYPDKKFLISCLIINIIVSKIYIPLNAKGYFFHFASSYLMNYNQYYANLMLFMSFGFILFILNREHAKRLF